MKNFKKTEKKVEVNNNDLQVDLTETSNDLGVISIHENVIISIVRAATVEVEGVSRLAGNSLVDNIAGLVGSKKIADRAISVELDGSNVVVDVEINVKYQSNIPTVAADVQKKICEMVESTTGMNVVKVNVIIQEIDVAPELEEEEEIEEEVE